MHAPHMSHAYRMVIFRRAPVIEGVGRAQFRLHQSAPAARADELQGLALQDGRAHARLRAISVWRQLLAVGRPRAPRPPPGRRAAAQSPEPVRRAPRRARRARGGQRAGAERGVAPRVLLGGPPGLG